MAPTRTTFPKSATAILIVDAINPLDFPGGRIFAKRAASTARRIARLAERARQAGVPVIFVNDNLGRWRPDIDALIEYVSAPGQAGRLLVEVLRPQRKDFVVLKSTLSGFHQTPLDAMLRQGEVGTVVVTGFVTGNCVLFTAADAYMRDYRVVVPRDCVADLTPEEHRDALKKIASVLKAQLPRSSQLRLRRK
jgi:nicotinamidase-related amidase